LLPRRWLAAAGVFVCRLASGGFRNRSANFSPRAATAIADERGMRTLISLFENLIATLLADAQAPPSFRR